MLYAIFCRLLDRSEELVRVASRQKVRDFCQKMLSTEPSVKKPIYLMATLIEINKADQVNLEETTQVIDSFNI